MYWLWIRRNCVPAAIRSTGSGSSGDRGGRRRLRIVDTICIEQILAADNVGFWVITMSPIIFCYPTVFGVVVHCAMARIVPSNRFYWRSIGRVKITSDCRDAICRACLDNAGFPLGKEWRASNSSSEHVRKWSWDSTYSVAVCLIDEEMDVGNFTSPGALRGQRLTTWPKSRGEGEATRSYSTQMLRPTRESKFGVTLMLHIFFRDLLS